MHSPKDIEWCPVAPLLRFSKDVRIQIVDSIAAAYLLNLELWLPSLILLPCKVAAVSGGAVVLLMQHSNMLMFLGIWGCPESATCLLDQLYCFVCAQCILATNRSVACCLMWSVNLVIASLFKCLVENVSHTVCRSMLLDLCLACLHLCHITLTVSMRSSGSHVSRRAQMLAFSPIMEIC